MKFTPASRSSRPYLSSRIIGLGGPAAAISALLLLAPPLLAATNNAAQAAAHLNQTGRVYRAIVGGKPVPADELEAHTSEYGGIGALMRRSTKEGVRVAGLFSGSPGAEAGLELHDEVLGVGDTRVDGLSLAEVCNLIRGRPGTTVALTVRKRRGGKPVVLQIERKRITPRIAPGATRGEPGK